MRRGKMSVAFDKESNSFLLGVDDLTIDGVKIHIPDPPPLVKLGPRGDSASHDTSEARFTHLSGQLGGIHTPARMDDEHQSSEAYAEYDGQASAEQGTSIEVARPECGEHPNSRGQCHPDREMLRGGRRPERGPHAGDSQYEWLKQSSHHIGPRASMPLHR